MEEQNFEEKRAEEIPVEEEQTYEGTGTEKMWTEEFVVAGEELVATIKKLVHEATVRRIIIRNKEKRIRFEIPLVLGITGIAMLPFYAAVALIAALVADCTITVERVADAEPEEAAA